MEQRAEGLLIPLPLLILLHAFYMHRPFAKREGKREKEEEEDFFLPLLSLFSDSLFILCLPGQTEHRAEKSEEHRERENIYCSRT